MIYFAHPVLLLLLWPILLLPLVWLYVQSRAERKLAAFAAASLHQRVRIRSSARRTVVRAGLMTIAVLLLVLAAAGPRSMNAGDTEEAVSPDIVLVLDVSRSMLCPDVPPDRLHEARRLLEHLVGQFPDSRIALVTFGGAASLMCPLTYDHRFVRTGLDRAGVHSAPGGETHVASGIHLALRLLRGNTDGDGTIVLVSDGEDMAGGIPAALSDAVAQGVRCLAVGIGTVEGGRIPVADGRHPFLVFQGAETITRRRDTVLHNIASATGGTAVLVGAEHEQRLPAERAAAGLRALAREAQRSALRRRDRHHYQWVLLPALLCALAAAWLSRSTRPTGEPPYLRLT